MSNPADNTPRHTFAGTLLCASCTARKEQAKHDGKLGFALCSDCSARTAADREEAGRLPWRWDTWALVDGDGAELIGSPDRDDDPIRFASPYVRAVTERAGRLDIALREALRMIEALAGLPIPFAADLLAEIDAAKAGG